MKKGIITVYLSLILCVMISLIFAAIDSVRLSCGRAVASLAAEEGMFSLFGEYDRILYEKYGLLLLDGGYGTPKLKAGALMDEAAGFIEKNLAQGTVFSGSSNLFRAGIESRAVTGYVLATDSGGAMLKDQIRSLMIRKLGADGAEALTAYFAGAADAARASESFDPERMESMRNSFEKGKDAAEEARLAAEEAARNAGELPASAPEKEEVLQEADSSNITAGTASGAADIIENIYALKRLGIMAAVVPDISALSTAQIRSNEMPSARSIAEGMGELPADSPAAGDAVLLARYITDFFPAFTDNEESAELKYQAEYAVAGKNRDIDNLKFVLNRLLILRMALNYSYLITHPEKTEQAGMLALAISVVLLIPEFAELVRQIILMCWSYGESMLDLKSLLAGGRIPLLKDESSWQSSLSGLASLSAQTEAGRMKKGLDYKEYLCILLILKGSARLIGSIEDLLEYNRRIQGGEPGFSIDTCLCSMEIQLEGSIGSHPFVLTRRYGYDTIGL